MNGHILHIIDTLGNGGAEILLKNTVNLLNEFDHTVVYLHKPDELINQFTNKNTRFINLDHKGWHSILQTKKKLAQIIQSVNPSIVHSHLIKSTICARLAVPKNIPLVSTLHSMYSIDAFKKNKKSLWVERLTLKKRHSLIAVSNYVLEDYLKYIPFKGKSFTLYNFIPEVFYEYKKNKNNSNGTLKCIAVGHLKEAKNYHYILEIWKELKDKNIHLDIYGHGYLKKDLEKIIREGNLQITLCGQIRDIKTLLPNYDLFIQASEHEGFGLSVIEAMAIGLPLLIADIPVFREVTNNNAYFFPLNNKVKTLEIFNELFTKKSLRYKYVNEAYDYCKKMYSPLKYKKNLLEIYESVSTAD